MTSVVTSRVLPLALLLALGTAGSGSVAWSADLGGDCCADLEERIAELEATTARKGNRKVSLTVSGWVNEAIFLWDDGTESNVYVGTNSLEQSRVKFTGEAKIDGDWSAGYTLELGLNTSASNSWDQDNDNGTAAAITVRKSNWYVKSKSLGKLTVGLDGTATYHLLDDADGTATRNYSDAEAAAVAQGRFLLRDKNGNSVNGLRWSDILRGPNNGTPGQNGRRNVVRYDSPEFAGFVVTASWGEDDMYGGALTYKGEWGDFKVVGKAGYEKSTDENTQQCHQTFDSTADITTGKADCEWFGAAATVMHVPTGLFVYGGFGRQNDDSRASDVAAANRSLVVDDDKMWFIQAGLETKLVPLGKTTFFGEYRNDEAGSNVRGNAANPAPNQQIRTQFSDIDFFAAGVIQNIEAAAMDLYVIYRHAEGDVRVGTAAVNTELDDFDMVITGARIQF